jgi:hypothetical protein
MEKVGRVFPAAIWCPIVYLFIFYMYGRTAAMGWI